MSVLTRGIPSNTVTNSQAASQNIGTSSVTVLPANGNRQFLMIQNLHATNNIGITFDGTTPAIGTAGTFTMFGGTTNGGLLRFEIYVPVGPINIIASGSSTPVSVNEG